MKKKNYLCQIWHSLLQITTKPRNCKKCFTMYLEKRTPQNLWALLHPSGNIMKKHFDIENLLLIKMKQNPRKPSHFIQHYRITFDVCLSSKTPLWSNQAHYEKSYFDTAWLSYYDGYRWGNWIFVIQEYKRLKKRWRNIWYRNHQSFSVFVWSQEKPKADSTLENSTNEDEQLYS
jgi:hypothetical protein